MDRKQLARNALQPFENLDVVRKYFASVQAMDKAAVANKAFDTDRIMALWERGGKLTISGKPIGRDKSYSGTREIASFYRQRAKGVDGEFSLNASSLQIANAKNPEHVVASGTRYVVTHNDEGLQVPFTHNFTLRDGRITDLKIHVGNPGKSEIAPVGTLRVEDLGRLAAMAWMVA